MSKLRSRRSWWKTVQWRRTTKNTASVRSEGPVDAETLRTSRVVWAGRITLWLCMALLFGTLLYGWLTQRHEASASARTSRPTVMRTDER